LFQERIVFAHQVEQVIDYHDFVFRIADGVILTGVVFGVEQEGVECMWVRLGAGFYLYGAAPFGECKRFG
jgi:hypothetical protein